MIALLRHELALPQGGASAGGYAGTAVSSAARRASAALQTPVFTASRKQCVIFVGFLGEKCYLWMQKMSFALNYACNR